MTEVEGGTYFPPHTRTPRQAGRSAGSCRPPPGLRPRRPSASPLPARDTGRAMSRENVEIVRKAFEAEARRDLTTLHGLYDPQVEMDFSDSPFTDFAGAAPRRGLNEVRAAFRDFYASFVDVESDVHDLIDAGEHVVSVFTYRGRGRTSGIETAWKDMAGVWTLHAGKIVRVTWLRSREEALEAVGLRE